MTVEDLEVLTSCIYEYTIKLAKDKKVELTEEELYTSEKNNTDTIINSVDLFEGTETFFEEVARRNLNGDIW